jgi:hypothetical protein
VSVRHSSNFVFVSCIGGLVRVLVEVQVHQRRIISCTAVSSAASREISSLELGIGKYRGRALQSLLSEDKRGRIRTNVCILMRQGRADLRNHHRVSLIDICFRMACVQKFAQGGLTWQSDFDT